MIRSILAFIMQISFLCLVVIFTITFVTADVDSKKVDIRLPVHKPEELDDRNPENVNVLLATLFEMHHDLLSQISLLEDKLKTSLPSMEKSEINHLVEHYVAQKNNIELSIQQIQSNDGIELPKERAVAKDSSIETKSIPLLVNFFKRTQSQFTDQKNPTIAYSLPYQQPNYEPSPQPQPLPVPQPQPIPTFVYQASQPMPVPNQQIFVPAAASQPQYQPPIQVQYQPQIQIQPQPHLQPQPYQEQIQVDQQTIPQYAPAPQVTLYSQAQETLPENQYQPQYQIEEQSQMEQQLQPQQHQFQQQVQPQPQQQEQLQLHQQLQPQQQVQSQQQQQQQVQPQQQEQSQLQQQFQPQQQFQQLVQPQHQTQSAPQQQFDFETLFRPSSVPVRRPQVSEHDTQRYQQQGPFGQKEGIFVYYPNGLITDDKERPTIANRFGQAFDRFGQAISNLGYFQQSVSSPTENVVSSAPRLESASSAKNKVKGSLQKISSQENSKKAIDDKTKSKDQSKDEK